MSGQQLARSVSDVDARLLLPVRLDVHRPPDAQPGEAAAVRDGRDRDLAEPAARVPAPQREHRARQRPHLAAIVPALSAHPAVLPSRARRHRPLLRAGRRDRSPPRQARRRREPRHRHRQPEVRLARSVDCAGPRPRACPALLPHLAGTAGVRRRQHDAKGEEEAVIRAFNRVRTTQAGPTRC